MPTILRPLERADLAEATRIWNQVVEEGDSFPGDEPLSQEEAWQMFREQTLSVCAVKDGSVAGLYILHPNGIGRLAHTANASYAVSDAHRGRGIGRLLVAHCIEQSRLSGFRGIQFNAVVASNYRAITLYLKMGFCIVGTVRGGFRMKDGAYSDMIIFHKSLAD